MYCYTLCLARSLTHFRFAASPTARFRLFTPAAFLSFAVPAPAIRLSASFLLPAASAASEVALVILLLFIAPLEAFTRFTNGRFIAALGLPSPKLLLYLLLH